MKLFGYHKYEGINVNLRYRWKT